MQHSSLKGKVALVTGSSRGIGFNIARALAGAGCDLVVTSRSQSDCEKAAARINEKTGRKVLAVESDISNLSRIKKLFDSTIDEYNKLDILVNNAGVAITEKAEKITEKEWDKVISVNLKGVFFCAQQAGINMKKNNGGKIINISSIFGQIAEKMISPYCAAKGGVNQLTRALALEWARYDIQVNAICPGYIKTSLNAEELENEKFYNHIINKIPAKRLGKPEDIEKAAVFLASKASDYMTGQFLTIDGGWTSK
ncbi:MAG: SDR family NAD(P)-dependent oxidoreductase [Halanaerobiales bacterium]